jgi:hypothetical protein
MRNLIKFAFVLSMVALPVGLLGQGRSSERPVNPPNGQGRVDTKKKAVPVPEPSTLLLMGAAAALGVRKLWQRRR